jgi:hypothetical protein
MVCGIVEKKPKDLHGTARLRGIPEWPDHKNVDNFE